MKESQLQRLQAYHDGELGWLGRLRVERMLRVDAEARAQFGQWREIGSLLRERESEATAPDLWAAIRAELPRGPLTDAAEAPFEWFPDIRGWFRWGAPLAAAAAGAAVALTLLLQPGDAAPGPSIRWLDSGGRPALVLQDDREATIIWVLDGPARVSQGGRRAIL